MNSNSVKSVANKYSIHASNSPLWSWEGAASGEPCQKLSRNRRELHYSTLCVLLKVSNEKGTDAAAVTSAVFSSSPRHPHKPLTGGSWTTTSVSSKHPVVSLCKHSVGLVLIDSEWSSHTRPRSLKRYLCCVRMRSYIPSEAELIETGGCLSKSSSWENCVKQGWALRSRVIRTLVLF